MSNCEFDYLSEGLTRTPISARCRREECRAVFDGILYYVLDNDNRFDFVRDEGIYAQLQEHHDKFKKENVDANGDYINIRETCGWFEIEAIDESGLRGLIKFTSDNWPIGIFRRNRS